VGVDLLDRSVAGLEQFVEVDRITRPRPPRAGLAGLEVGLIPDDPRGDATLVRLRQTQHVLAERVARIVHRVVQPGRHTRGAIAVVAGRPAWRALDNADRGHPGRERRL